MDLNRIRYFITLAEQLHFGRAADLLYISQSSLSYHISELEQELGITLFTRSKRKVLLTSTGTALLPIAKELWEIAQKLERTASSDLKEPSPTTLNICFDASYERFDLLGIADSISSLRRTYPGLSISFSLKNLPDLLADTENMTCDIGFGILRNDEKANELLNTLPLYEEPLALVYNLDGEENADVDRFLSRYPIYLTRGDERWTGYITNVLTARGVFQTPILMDNFSEILTHVYLGEGITVLPHTQYRAEAITRPGLRCIPLDDPSCQLRTCAFWAKGNYNYAITLLLAGIHISPEVLSLFE